ncbi:hypothetical protein B0J11DRAFT_614921 [Dendryphion nanum]|uniref:Uncharacterized protein n=1 Tax=Dendryphion nanum TaxID=256645 RepID=A0A9P9DV34_9PLEO|nr:hypothetical protein B0J11DRAFT_614921 [Dendryphion nanum]
MLTYSKKNRMMRIVGDDAAMIKSNLQKLRNVKHLQFVEACSCFCHSPAGASYGLTYLREKVGASAAAFELMDLDGTQFMARIFAIALDAADRAGLQLETVDAQMAHTYGRRIQGKQLHGFNAARLDFPFHEISAGTFEHLSLLRIYVSNPHDTKSNKGRTQLCQRLEGFLLRCTSLKTFGITFGDGIHATKILDKLFSSKALAHIEKLEISNIYTNAPELIELLALVQHLRGIKLRSCCVDDFGFYDILT